MEDNPQRWSSGYSSYRVPLAQPERPARAMTYGDWAGLIVSICTIAGAFVMAIQWLVKHYLNELKPNSGSSLSDRVNRIEAKLETVLELLKK